MACDPLKAVYRAQPRTMAKPATSTVRPSSVRRTCRNLARSGAAITGVDYRVRAPAPNRVCAQSRVSPEELPAFVCNRCLNRQGLKARKRVTIVQSVGRVARVPGALTRGPFTLAEAARHGLACWHLEGDAWRRVGPGTYLSERVDQTPLMRIEAANWRLPPQGAFSGFTAAWLHGLDVPPCDPIESQCRTSAESRRALGCQFATARWRVVRL